MGTLLFVLTLRFMNESWKKEPALEQQQPIYSTPRDICKSICGVPDQREVTHEFQTSISDCKCYAEAQRKMQRKPMLNVLYHGHMITITPPLNQ